MPIDSAVVASIYKRSSTITLPADLFEEAARTCGGEFLPKGDSSQTLFLCRDKIAISFWLRCPGEKPSHVLASFDPDKIAQTSPELADLWAWQHVDDTWDEIQARFVGSTDVSSYARILARLHPQCFNPKDTGIN